MGYFSFSGEVNYHLYYPLPINFLFNLSSIHTSLRYSFVTFGKWQRTIFNKVAQLRMLEQISEILLVITRR